MSTPDTPVRAPSGEPSAGEEPRRRWRPELVLALVVLALGVLVIVGTLDVSAAASQLGIGPRFFPTLVGGAMIVIGVFYVIDVLRGGQGDPEESEDVDAGAPADWRSVALATQVPGVAASSASVVSGGGVQSVAAMSSGIALVALGVAIGWWLRRPR
jgi:putative tricarboxylic transport membrane protein